MGDVVLVWQQGGGLTHIITTSSRPDNEEHCEVTPAWVMETCRWGQKLLEYDFCPEDNDNFVECVEEPEDNIVIINKNVNGKKKYKRKNEFDGMDEDSGIYSSCNSSRSTPSSIGLNDTNSNSVKKIIHTSILTRWTIKRLKL